MLHCTPEHPTVVGDECVIGHIVHLEGCRIDDRAMVANGAIVLHRSVVGTGAVVGANAVVLSDVDVPPGALAVGAPATVKPGRARMDDIVHSVETYVARAARYRDALRRLRLMLALVLTVPANEVELASDALWALGVAAVEERSAEPDRVTATEDRFVELWTVGRQRHRRDLPGGRGIPRPLALANRRIDPAVTESWRAHAVPSWVDRSFVIVPAWLDVETPPTVLRVDIDPGAAFGLGDHPSTVLALRLLRKVWYPGATVLDVGCGSGVLSVVAARLGAPYVEAIDVATAAIEATIANASRNGVLAAVAASTQPLSSIVETFDLVLANLLAPTLVDLASDLRRVVSPSGELIVSGVLDGAYEHVVDALAPMQPVETITREGWAALLLRH